MPNFIEEIKEITATARKTEQEIKREKLQKLNEKLEKEAISFVDLYAFNLCKEEITNQAKLGKNVARFHTAVFSVDQELQKGRIAADRLMELLQEEGFKAKFYEQENDGPYTSWSVGVDISW